MSFMGSKPNRYLEFKNRLIVEFMTILTIFLCCIAYGLIGAIVLFSKLNTFKDNEIYSPLHTLVLILCWPIVIFNKKEK